MFINMRFLGSGSKENRLRADNTLNISPPMHSTGHWVGYALVQTRKKNTEEQQNMKEKLAKPLFSKP